MKKSLFSYKNLEQNIMKLMKILFVAFSALPIACMAETASLTNMTQCTKTASGAYKVIPRNATTIASYSFSPSQRTIKIFSTIGPNGNGPAPVLPDKQMGDNDVIAAGFTTTQDGMQFMDTEIYGLKYYVLTDNAAADSCSTTYPCVELSSTIPAICA